MKRVVMLILWSLVLSTTATAQDHSGKAYLQVYGGASYFGEEERNGVDVSYDLGYTVGVRMGTYLNSNVRLDGDLSYSNNEFDEVNGLSLASAGIEADVTVVTFGIGAYADLVDTGALRPYFGVGIGGAYKDIDANLNVDTLESTDLTVHAEAGLSFHLAPNFALVPHYRLLWLDEYADDPQLVHWFRLGIRFIQ